MEPTLALVQNLIAYYEMLQGSEDEVPVSSRNVLRSLSEIRDSLERG